MIICNKWLVYQHTSVTYKPLVTHHRTVTLKLTRAEILYFTRHRLVIIQILVFTVISILSTTFFVLFKIVIWLWILDILKSDKGHK